MKCNICYVQTSALKNDHCHYHDQQRGKICHRCNILMGQADRGKIILVPWVSAERIVAYRKRCSECSAEDIHETIRKYEEKRETELEVYLATAKPIAILPEPIERIRLRNLFGITQQELASTLNVSRRTIHSWELGRGNPTGMKREKYAEVLNLWQELECVLSKSTNKGNAKCRTRQPLLSSGTSRMTRNSGLPRQGSR